MGGEEGREGESVEEGKVCIYGLKCKNVMKGVMKGPEARKLRGTGLFGGELIGLPAA